MSTVGSGNIHSHHGKGLPPYTDCPSCGKKGWYTPSRTRTTDGRKVIQGPSKCAKCGYTKGDYVVYSVGDGGKLTEIKRSPMEHGKY